MHVLNVSCCRAFYVIAVLIVGRIEHSRTGRDANRALVSTVALGAVLTDLFLNRSRVEVRCDR